MGPWRTISVALRGDVSGLVAATTAGSNAVRKFGADTEASLGRADGAFGRTGSRWQTISSGLAVGFLAVGAALGFSLFQAISWESAFAGVAKTVDGTTAELADLEAELLDLSNRLPATREEIAGVAEAAGALGIERENIAAFTETMIGLGEATNLTADEAATMLAQFANIMGTPQAAVESLADALVNLGNNGASTEREILDMALRLAGAGATIGLTEDQVLALSNAMASMGIPAELGGSALSRVMAKIEVAVANGADKVHDFAEITGESAAQFAAAWESDPGAAFENFVTSLGTLQEEGANVIGLLAELGIKGQQERDVMLRLTSGHEGLAKSMDDVADSAGALATEVDKRYATAESQLRTFRNQVTNIARVAGAELIPALLASLDAARAFGEWLGGVGADVADRLEPAWRSLVDTGENLADLLGALYAAGEPIGALFAQLAGAAIVGTFTGLAQVVESATDLLADHEEIVTGLVYAYLTLKGAALAGAAWTTITTGVQAATAAMLELRAAVAAVAATRGVTTLTASIGILKASLTGLSAIGAGAFAGIAIGVTGATLALNKLHDSGKRAANQFLDRFEDVDTTSLDAMVERMRDLQAERAAIQEELDRDGITAFDTERLSAEVAEIDKALGEISDPLGRAARGLSDFRDETGLTVAQVEDLARAAGVDLPNAFDESGKPVPELVKEYERLVDVSERWGGTVADAAGLAADELDLLEDQIARIDAAGQATRDAWSGWADLLSITDNPVDADAVANSEKILQDAKDRVAEAEAEARAQGQTADDALRSAEALADARDALRDATESHADLLATDSPLNADKVKVWYADRLAEARTFTDDLNTAIAAGYDPALITRLMQAGPEAAGPVLAALVEDTSASYVTSINNAEAALTDFTTFAVRQAQLTQRAIELGTREAAEDLATALAIEQQALLDPSATIYDIAARLNLAPEDVARVVEDFNLDFVVDPDLSVVAEKLDDLARKPRIAQIIAEAVYATADEDLTEVERRDRVALIVAEALTTDAELGFDEVSATRIANIIAYAATANADEELGEVAGRERIAEILLEAITDEAEAEIAETARDRIAWITLRTRNEAIASIGGGAPPGFIGTERNGSGGIGPVAGNVIAPPEPRQVPAGGALAPGAGGNGGRLAPVIGTINVYETSTPEVTVGDLQTKLSLYG